MDVNVKTQNIHELEALLEFYAANGVDCALDELPHNYFEEFEAAQAARRQQAQSQRPQSAAVSPAQRPVTAPAKQPNFIKPAEAAVRPADADAFSEARERASSAETLEALRQALSEFDGCNLKRTAKSLVFGNGNPKARLMFVGEAPGRDEDIGGAPFIGRSGQLLDRMIAAIGLEREADTYVANVVPWRPPGNRTPTPQETELCRPFIERQIELINPDILVPLGGAAAKQLFETTDGILKLRGRLRTYKMRSKEIPAMATLHPAYLLRQPGQKRLAWQDFLKIKKTLTETTDTE